MTLAFLDIDLHAGEGARLLTAVQGTAPQLAGAASLLGQTFLIRSPWAPGLRFVGALASQNGSTFSVGGAGLSVDRALISCLGEAAERLSQVERRGDVLVAGGHADCAISPAVNRLCALVGPRRAFADFDWVAGVDLLGDPSAIAADWCLRRSTDGPMRVPGTMLSTGCAAGRDKRDARVRALLELIERDAAALWWSGACEPRAIDIGGAIADLIATLRAGAPTRRTWLLDISSDIDIPVTAAVSCDSDGCGVAVGLGAHIVAEDAHRKALLELCQMEIGLQLARLKSHAELTADDRRHLARGAMAATDRRLQASIWSTKHECDADQDAMKLIVDAFARHALDAVLVDLTRPDIGVSVIKAVTPDLQPMPGAIQTARLAARLRDCDEIWPADVPLH